MMLGSLDKQLTRTRFFFAIVLSILCAPWWATATPKQPVLQLLIEQFSRCPCGEFLSRLYALWVTATPTQLVWRCCFFVIVLSLFRAPGWVTATPKQPVLQLSIEQTLRSIVERVCALFSHVGFDISQTRRCPCGEFLSGLYALWVTATPTQLVLVLVLSNEQFSWAATCWLCVAFFSSFYALTCISIVARRAVSIAMDVGFKKTLVVSSSTSSALFALNPPFDAERTNLTSLPSLGVSGASFFESFCLLVPPIV
jgi:hypothetical protein